MRRFTLPAALLAGLLAGCAGTADQAQQQALVDRATLSVAELMSVNGGAAQPETLRLLHRARAVVVCPRLFRAGFILGAEGGSCVMVGRDAAGSWSSPAFYGLGSGSVGLQAGIQDSELMMMILTDRGLTAMIDNQFKFGADASLALATLGGGIEGSTTAAAGADIVAIARSRGLFAGIVLAGSVLSPRSDQNRAYYGRNITAQQLVIGMEAHNPGADPLRAALLRYGAAEGPPPPPAAAPRDAEAPMVQPAPRGMIGRETLPPTRR